MSEELNRTLGKLPPQSLDFEELVLGAIMLEKAALPSIMDMIKPDSFYDDKHKKIYEACISLFDKSEPIDIATVTQELRELKLLESAGGAFYVTKLTSKINSAANIEFHCRIIQENYLKRELIAFAGGIGKKAFKDSEDVFKILDGAEQELFKIGASTSGKNHVTIRKSMGEVIKDIEDKKNRPQDAGGIESGFPSLDKITGGFQKSDLIIVAARPGMGKTALALTIVRNAAVDFNRKVAVFSLEMTNKQLTTRLLSTESGIDNEKLRQGKLTDQDFMGLHGKISRLVDSNIYLDDQEALPVREFRSKARRMVQQHGIELIIVDYLQLMTTEFSGTGKREQEISTISSTLKSVAKELQVPVIALSQLSRAVESRANKRPQLSDLRESGAIEQDADIVTFLYRPGYYGITGVQDRQGRTMDNTATMLIFGKHRNGSLDDINLSFKDRLTKFEEYHFEDEPPLPTPGMSEEQADDIFTDQGDNK